MGVASLSSGFLLTSMIGFLLSVLYVPRFSTTWAVTFALVFVLMFISSMISMVQGNPLQQLGTRAR